MKNILTEIKQVLKYSLLATIIEYILISVQIGLYYLEGINNIDYMRAVLYTPVFSLFSVILYAYVIYPLCRLFD